MGLALAVLLLIPACTGAGDDLPTTPTTRVGVPDVRGLITAEADRALQRAGLLLEVAPVGGGDSVVISQSPQPGEPVPSNSIVQVQARCFPAPCPFPGEGKEIYDPCTCAAR